MNVRSYDITSAKTYCEARLTLEISNLKNAIKFRHVNDTGLSRYNSIDQAISQLRTVRKLYTLYEGLYLLEEKLGYDKKEVQDRDTILSALTKSS